MTIKVFFSRRENGCVTYDSVNRAFHAAAQRTKYPLRARSKSRAMTDIDVDHFGHVMLETTRILAREYGLLYLCELRCYKS